MITTHYRARRTVAHPGGLRRRRPRRLAPLRTTVPSTSTAPGTTTCPEPVRFVFQGGAPLSPTDLATLRLFAAAGIRPRCVVAGSDHAPDASLFRAALGVSSGPAASRGNSPAAEL